MMFQDAVRNHRIKHGLSMTRLARGIGVHWMTVWRWERGLNLPKENVRDYWLSRVEGIKK